MTLPRNPGHHNLMATQPKATKVALTPAQIQMLLDGISQQLMDLKAKETELRAQHRDLSAYLKPASPEESKPQGLTPESRRRISEAQKARWAKKKQASQDLQSEVA